MRRMLPPPAPHANPAVNKTLDDEKGSEDADIDIDDVGLDDLDTATAVDRRPVFFNPELQGM